MFTINLPDVTPLWVTCTIPRLVTIHYKQCSVHTQTYYVCVFLLYILTQPHACISLMVRQSSMYTRKLKQNVFAVPPQCYFTFFTARYPEGFQIFFFFEDW